MNCRLVIEIVNGQLKISGPIQDKMLCYGMLELAKDAIRDMHAKAAEGPKIETAPPAIAGLLANGR